MSREIEADLKREGFPHVMSAGEAARALRCSTRRIWYYAEQGRLPKYNRAGGAALFRRSDVAKLVTR